MNELHVRLAKLHADAADCAQIRDLATDAEKRELFARLARHLKVLAEDMERVMEGSGADD